MLQVRKSVFETNSSSVHSLTMCSNSEYERWEKGELLFYWSDFVPVEEAVKQVEEYRKKYEPENVGKPIDNEVLKDHEFYRHDDFWNDKEECYETFYDEYEGVVAFGYYGSGY